MATTRPDGSEEAGSARIAAERVMTVLAGEERATIARLRDFVRQRPLLAVGAAAAAGTAIGGLLFPRVARLVFIAAAGYVGTELWRREGRIDVRELAAKLSR